MVHGSFFCEITVKLLQTIVLEILSDNLWQLRRPPPCQSNMLLNQSFLLLSNKTLESAFKIVSLLKHDVNKTKVFQTVHFLAALNKKTKQNEHVELVVSLRIVVEHPLYFKCFNKLILKTCLSLKKMLSVWQNSRLYIRSSKRKLTNLQCSIQTIYTVYRCIWIGLLLMISTLSMCEDYLLVSCSIKCS